jgi:hypothetical protein
MARLLSVNVGLPRDIAWKGRTVHTGIWKTPVGGRCRVGRLNLDGDGQGDLAGPRADVAPRPDLHDRSALAFEFRSAINSIKMSSKGHGGARKII